MYYFGVFHSKLSYGITIWGSSSAAKNAFIMQKRVLRVLVGAGYREPCQPLFRRHKIMPLPSLYLYYALLEIYNQKDKLPSTTNLHSYNLRNCNLEIPKFRLTKSKKNYLDFNIFNILPNGVKQMNPKEFKRTIKNYLLMHCFYGRDEYLRSDFKL